MLNNLSARLNAVNADHLGGTLRRVERLHQRVVGISASTCKCFG